VGRSLGRGRFVDKSSGIPGAVPTVMRMTERERSVLAPRVARSIVAVVVCLTSLWTVFAAVAGASVPAVTFGAPDVTSGYDFAATVVGDFTRDGVPDVLAATSDYPTAEPPNSLFVLAQQSDGSLGPPVLSYSLGTPRFMSMAAGSFNSDRRLDVAIATDTGVEILTQNRRGRLELTSFIQLRYGATQILARRMLGTRVSDLVVNSPSGVYVIENLGLGRWRKQRIWVEPFSQGERSIAAGDVTGDGKKDVVIYRAFQHPHLVVFAWQRGGSYLRAGGYEPVNDGNWGWSLAIGDVTGDGRNDVVLSIADNQPKAGIDIFAGRPNGTLGSPHRIHTDDGPEVVSLADLNADGRKDVVVLHGGFAEAGIMMQQEDGSIGPESLSLITHVSHYYQASLSIGDVNSDAKRDFVIGSTDLVVLRQS